MFEEATISKEAAVLAVRILEEEINARIRHGDGGVETLQEVCDALFSCDRIVINE